MSLNQCAFIGNLGADPEVRRTQSGNPVVSLRLAVSEKWRDKNSGEQREKTEWVPVVIFSDGLCKIAEQYLRKGSKVYVSGKFQTRKWQDQEGKDRYSTEVVLQGFDAKLTMLDGPKGNSDARRDDYSQNYRPSGQGGGFGGGQDEDSIPF